MLRARADVALYQWARTALIAQLRSVQRRFPIRDHRERLSLEEACARSNRKPRARPRSLAARRWRCGARRRRLAAVRRPPEDAPSAAPSPGPRRVRGQGSLRDARPPLGQSGRSPRDLRADAPPPGAPRPQPPQIPIQEVGRGRMPSRRSPRHGAPTRSAAAAACAGPQHRRDADVLAAPPRKPTVPRGKPRQRASRLAGISTGSSRAWKPAAPIPRRPIR